MAAPDALPVFVPPQLVSAGRLPADADSDSWAAEIKWDGIRCQVRVVDGVLTARTRPGRDTTASFPELAGLAEALAGRDAILDGELVCLAEDGAPDFERVRARMSRTGRSAVAGAAEQPARLQLFDLLYLSDRGAVWELSLAERRELLESLALDGRAWNTPRQFVGQASDLRNATQAANIEGIVVKDRRAPYVPGPRRRPPSWVKVKNRRVEELAVLAWRPPGDGQPPEFALARRGEADGALTFAGTASFGAATPQLLDLLPSLELPRGRRRRMRSVDPVVRVRVSTHGRPGGPLRDASIQAVVE